MEIRLFLLYFTLIFAPFGFCQLTPRAQSDKIGSLPGVIFQTSFNQYAGYLNSNPQSNSDTVHYWFIESQLNSTSDSLLLFINGGPGCSSVFGQFQEIGPFRAASDGKTLYENVFSWNKVSNLLAIDAPGTGFSWQETGKMQDDSFVTESLLNALSDFYTVHPNFLKNDLYIAGEGYGSFFAAAMMESLLVNNTPQPEVLTRPINIKGLLLANGDLSARHQYNSLIPYYYTHGFIGSKQYDKLKTVCCSNSSTLLCDFYNSNETCKHEADLILATLPNDLLNSNDIYQDCYRNEINRKTAMKQLATNNYNSTDSLAGYPCTAISATTLYLNREDVQAAIHVSSKANKLFQSCRSVNFTTYSNDLQIRLSSILTTKNYKLNSAKVMIYNGDVDLRNNFIGAQRFAQELASNLKLNVTEDRIWRHNYDSAAFKWMDGGVITSYTSNFHVASIRGAGHYAPQNRPSQSLQLYRDFVLDLFFNNCLSRVNKVAAPLLPAYQSQIDTISRKQSDKVLNLPGLTYKINFDHYSGYLNASANHQFHYWFVQSQVDPANSPVLLWLNGGPGSSSLWGMLTENGPFRPNKDGETLYENVYSWNKLANVLYLESPHQVGFSYSKVVNDYNYGDDLTAADNYNAIKDFFTNLFPEYQSNPFYITGESYGGVYIPTLSKLLIEKISLGDINVNFKGIAIGNGELTTQLQVNSAIFQLYTYGLVGETEYNNLVAQCCKNFSDPTECDFYSPYIYFDYLGNYRPVDGADSFCSKTILGIVNDQVWNTANDPYNIYQDCYRASFSASSSAQESRIEVKQAFKNNAKLLNTDSSDPFNGFPCWSTDATTKYLNRDDVRTALHIPSFVQSWQSFNETVNEKLYNRSYFELDGVLNSIISSYYYRKNNMKILIYNGDVDMVCNHLGDQWLIEKLARENNISTVTQRVPWNYVIGGSDYLPQLAGYIKVFESNINLVTVKGSGHLVPQDRPGPALQMIYNFINEINFNTTFPSSLSPSTLLPSYNNLFGCNSSQYPAAQTLPTLPPLPPLPPGVTYPFGNYRKKRSAPESSFMNTDVQNPTSLTQEATSDMIQSLPGLTFNVTYRMFSGYLTSDEKPLNHLFYWFIESQNDAVNDPVVLWLNGGPGCSSLGGFFTELGPFHPNDDGGQTLYENVFSWNKKANVLFLEAPVKVGFSYTEDSSYYWNDDTTAENNGYAIKTFFTKKFPQYAQNEFFVTGESYGGVYCPTLTLNLIQQIDAGILSLNFKGTAVGNGILSEYLQTNSEIVLQYGRGFNSLKEWNDLKKACNLSDSNPIYFDYQGAPDGSACAEAVNENQDKFYDFDEANGDPYNMYQDCYLYDKNGAWKTPQSESFVGKTRSRREKAHKALKNRRKQFNSNFYDSAFNNWYGSTDPFRGLNCFSGDALSVYLSRSDVQEAIHAKPKNIWVDCADENPDNHWRYHTQEKYYDMQDTISAIMDSSWYSKNNMRLMFYNGDVDTICQFLGDEWLIENLVTRRNLTVLSQRQPWIYQQSGQDVATIAGYVKSWSQNVVQLTVKGSGHFVPSDRPAQALQMLNNFLANEKNYSTPTNVNLMPQPIFTTYETPVICSASQSDRIFNLPGLPEDIQFKQYSGFLEGLPGHRIHYWLIESESDPTNDPLLLWLNGGPGSSSLMGLFEENGPFRIDKGSKSLYRNPYSWNKFANVLYLESPIGVGFSYASNNTDVQYDDETTALENYNALKNFFKLYPQFTKTPFYTTGESYAGVYLPSLSALLVQGIKSGDIIINYKGLSIGNGVIDKRSDLDSQLHYQYYHGGISFSVYKTALDLCCTGDEFKCRFSDRMTVMNNSIPWGDLNDPCYVFIVSEGANLLLNSFDPYNLYQQCWTLSYNDTTPRTPYGESWTGINYDSTDFLNGYPCYMDDAMESYLNLPAVRKALNIPDSVQAWAANNNIINAYTQQIDSISENLKTIMKNAPANFNILLYSGDVDTMVNWLGAEIFTSTHFSNLGLQLTKNRTQWTYRSDNNYQPSVAGFQTSYTSDSVTIDVLTVKGSGHFVPLDRPQEALQMIYNFVNLKDYSSIVNFGPSEITTTSTTTTTITTTTKTTTTSSNLTVSTSPANAPTTVHTTTEKVSNINSVSLIFLVLLVHIF